MTAHDCSKAWNWALPDGLKDTWKKILAQKFLKQSWMLRRLSVPRFLARIWSLSCQCSVSGSKFDRRHDSRLQSRKTAVSCATSRRCHPTCRSYSTTSHAGPTADEDAHDGAAWNVRTSWTGHGTDGRTATGHANGRAWNGSRNGPRWTWNGSGDENGRTWNGPRWAWHGPGWPENDV